VAGSLLHDVFEAETTFLKNKVGSPLVRTLSAVALDSMTKDDVLLILEDICQTADVSEESMEDDEREEERNELTQKLVEVISSLATTPHKYITGQGCKTIMHEMRECIDQWACSSVQHHATNLLCLLASRFGVLHEVGSAIISLALREKDGNDVSPCIQSYFEFAAALNGLANPSTRSSQLPPVSNGSAGQQKEKSKLGVCRRTCTFIQTGEGFTEQHWYNCYTCGLLWDKGCCSLCVRVCHAGHDVGYSRKSSFFCDCGAEVASAVEENRTPCKCLCPVSEETVRALYEESSPVVDRTDVSTHQSDGFTNTLAESVFKRFPGEVKRSLQLLVEEAQTAEWNTSILTLFNNNYEKKPPASLDFSTIFSSTTPVSDASHGLLNLDSRRGSPLSLTPLVGTTILPLRAAKMNALKPRVNPLSAASHIRKVRTEGQLIASDDRGRLVCAESSSLLFFSGIACTNVRHIELSAAKHLTRSQLNVGGSERLKFEIYGIALCPENNRHLISWGASKACVNVLSKGFDSVERTIDLTLQLEPSECESEYLLELLWMTETIVIAICGTVIHVFDLKKTENDTCKATAHFVLAYEDVLIRSATFTSITLSDSGIQTKLAILLDTGRLHFIQMSVDKNGHLEEQGETYIEIGSGASFSSAGKSR
jgi:hypothetical protein